MDRPPYNTLNHYLRQRFGARVAKISIDAGFDCPNRDGTISSKGCIFCNEKGSGTGFHGRGMSVTEQIEKALPWLIKRYRTRTFIAYFQAFTNTYASVRQLERTYGQALAFPEVKVLAVGTRPDCLDQAKLDLLARINKTTEVWLELGLQSAHDSTLTRINRGHDFQTFARAAKAASERGLMVFAHLILGLPGEGSPEIAETIERIADLGLAGVKLHGLFVPRDAPLAELYRQGEIKLLTRAEYVDLVCGLVPILPREWIIQRIVSDPGRWTLLAPKWMLAKEEIIQEIQDRLLDQGIFQGQGRG